jgi:RNA 3'-terminal phosphate cyclase (ATP)
MLLIDGSKGEGGGQVLRTSLALSLLTGKPFRMVNIRAGRKRPGLLRQHLTGVEAAAALGRAEVRGAALGSRELLFTPGPVQPGDYHFAVGTAGSAMLVLQAVLPALLTASGPVSLTLEGGTHNSAAPPYDFVERAYLPLVRRMGGSVQVRLERHGFYPAGGGRVLVHVHPVARLAPLELLERGKVKRTRATALVAKLPGHVAQRELDVLAEGLALRPEMLRTQEVDSVGPGNALLVEVESEHVTELFTAFGERGTRAEDVAQTLVHEVRGYLDAGVPVGEHLADQLLLLLAVAGGGAFRTLPLSGHSHTQLETVRHFLPVQVDVAEEAPQVRRVTVRG